MRALMWQATGKPLASPTVQTWKVSSTRPTRKGPAALQRPPANAQRRTRTGTSNPLVLQVFQPTSPRNRFVPPGAFTGQAWRSSPREGRADSRASIGEAMSLPPREGQAPVRTHGAGLRIRPPARGRRGGLRLAARGLPSLPPPRAKDAPKCSRKLAFGADPGYKTHERCSHDERLSQGSGQ